MVAARDAREIAGFRYEQLIESIDWNRVLLQSIGLHDNVHPYLGLYETCGECIRQVLLRREE